MKKIPFNDFKKEYLRYKTEIDRAISRVLRSGWFILGKELEHLETDLAKLLKVKYCVGVGNGTDAITLALLALEIGSGDEVITSNVTAYPTITGIERSGAKPVVVDIDEDSGLIDPVKIEAAITTRTKALVPVHLYGQACEMDKIIAIAKRHKLRIIEDCAQSITSTYKNRPTGSFGDAGTLSFYPTKNLGAYGDAGAVVTNDRTVHEKLLQLRNYGQTVRYNHKYPGLNSRLDEIQAAILIVKLKHLPENIKKRRKTALRYNQELKINHIPQLKNNLHTYHLYVIKSSQRENLMKYLKARGIMSLIHYPIPINKQQAFKYQKNQIFPATEKFTREIVSLPIYPELTSIEVQYIIDTVNRFMQEKNLAANHYLHFPDDSDNIVLSEKIK
jgi:dTDP-4-amino-4,6-dideoxygalactose transaminase